MLIIFYNIFDMYSVYVCIYILYYRFINYYVYVYIIKNI